MTDIYNYIRYSAANLIVILNCINLKIKLKLSALSKFKSIDNHCAKCVIGDQ